MMPEDGTGSDVALQEEVLRLRSELDRARRVRARRTRRIATAVLAVVTTISVIAGTFAYWAHQTVFDQDHYMEVVGPLGADPAVTGALSTYLGTQIVTVLDLKTRIADALKDIPQLPEKADFLVGPVANAVANSADDLVRRRVSEFLVSQEFRNLWVEANRVGHEKVVALLRGDYQKLPNVKVGDAEVRLNLLPIVSRVLSRLVQDGVGRIAPGVTVPAVSVKDIPDSARQRLSQALGVTLPPDFGEVTIMSRQKLDTLQGTVNRLDRLVWGLILLSILLGAATVAMAVDKRKGLVELAVGVVAGLLLAAIAIRRVKEAVVDRIKSDEARGAARAVMDNTLGSLRAVAVVVIVAGIVVAVIAHLAGPPRWLTGSARWLRKQAGRPHTRISIAEHADGLRIAAVALGLLALFFTGINAVAVLIVGGVVAACLWAVDAVRRSAGPDEVDETSSEEAPTSTA
ncbi:MAG: hypothetical protein M3011_06930 [Actinomycetota bacterium]|nr:hypothetical protein [Actinomycetota bacterium]